MLAFVSVGAVTALNVRTQAYNIVGALIVGIGQATIPVAAMSNMAIRLFAVGMPIALMNTILMNFYQSTKKTGLATLICVLQSLVFTVSLSFLLIRPMGSNGVWTAFLLGEVFTFITIVCYVSHRNRKFSFNISSYMLLDDTFGGSAKDRLELSIGNSMEEVMEVSAGIYKFGKNRSIDEKMLNEISLCIEEMAGNVVQHGFKTGEKKWFDVMILDKPESVVIRIRDNGSAFDPASYRDAAGDSEKEGQFGIKIISSLAEQFDYKRSMGLNVLMIVLKKQDVEGRGDEGINS